MMCHVNGSMAVKSFSQCKARTNCLSKQINLSYPQRSPSIYSLVAEDAC